MQYTRTHINTYTHTHTLGMIKGRFGHVINISSIWGKAAPSNRSAYASAKFAIIALMDSIRHEVIYSVSPNDHSTIM